MELVVRAFAASTNQIWTLRKYISMTSLRVLDSYSFATTSEFSIDYLKTHSWSSCQIGKWAPSDGYCHVSWHFQYHKPWVLFTAMQRFKEVTAKDGFSLYFTSMSSVSCLHRFADPGQNSQCSPGVTGRHSTSHLVGHNSQVRLPLLLDHLASLELLKSSLWYRTGYDGALPCLLVLFWGLWVTGKTPDLSHLYKSTEAPRMQRQADRKSLALWTIWS